MIALADDPFTAPVIPKFREFEISIVGTKTDNNDATVEFVTTLQAINQIHPVEPVVVPEKAAFFDFSIVSPFEETFPFSKDPHYKEIRNFIVAVYRIFNKRYLPFTLCRRNVKAPVHLTYEIWNFLSKYGLINYNIEKSTVPPPLIPSNDMWPELIYTIDDTLLTFEQYNHKIHPIPKTTLPIPISPWHLTTMPHYSAEKRPHSAEIPGLMDFDGWNIQELRKISELPKLDSWKQSWDQLSAAVGSKSPQECASFLSQAPFVHNTCEAAAHSNTTDHLPPKELFEEEALSKFPELRLTSRAIKSVKGNAAKIMYGELVPTPEEPLEAAGIVATHKLSENAKKMEVLHKQRILDCLAMTVTALKQSIQTKKQAIDDSKAEISNAGTESEVSADEKTVQSETEEN